MKSYLKQVMEVVYVALAGFMFAILFGVDWVSFI